MALVWSYDQQNYQHLKLTSQITQIKNIQLQILWKKIELLNCDKGKIMKILLIKKKYIPKQKIKQFTNCYFIKLNSNYHEYCQNS